MSNFQPTRRDVDGLERLQDEIRRDYNRHEGYEIKCFQQEEAEWIKRRLLAWRPDLRNRLRMTWPVFEEREDKDARLPDEAG